ncbi:hypothetical protein OROHE_019218 [Orobanche hederae]
MSPFQKLAKAQAQRKINADKHRRNVQFDVDSWVYVKLQPYRQTSLSGTKYHKLSKQYYGLYLVMARVGPVAYKLELPPHSKIHNVFHTSLLKLHEGSPPNSIDQLPAYSVDNHPIIAPVATIRFQTQLIDGIHTRFALSYLDPEYVITQELTEKSDIYSYGVVLLELVTGRRAIQDNKNIVEWSKVFLTSDSRTTELVDPYLGDAFDFGQLQSVVALVTWCTQREGRARPSIKQVLRLLYESADPLHSGFIEAVEDEECGESESKSRKSRGKNVHSSRVGRCLASSSSTTRSQCSGSFLPEMGSPQSTDTPSL